MSNTQHNGEGTDPRTPKLPARNMADIARMFLEGARPLPVRTPPARRQAPQSTESPRDQSENTIGSETSAPQEAPGAATTVLGLAAASHDAGSWKLLVKAAQGLADEQSTTVALVGLFNNSGRTTFVADVVGVESADELPAMRTASDGSGGGTSDMQIARALHRLRPAIGVWIVAAPLPDSRAFPAIASIVGEWLLACPTDNDGLITGYQHLKQAWAAATKDAVISPKVYLLTEDYAQAAVVHKRLRKAAQEFLGTDLALAGAGPIRNSGAGGHGPIRILSLACQGSEDALWAAILDELCPMIETEDAPAAAPVHAAMLPATPVQRPIDPRPADSRPVNISSMDIETALEHVEGHAAQVSRHSDAAAAYVLDHLAQVLDPEERAALAADFEEPGVPVATPRMRDIPMPEIPPPAEGLPAPVVIKHNSAHSQADMFNARAAVTEPVSAPLEAPAAESRVAQDDPAAAAAGVPSLRAFDLDECSDRPAQWQAVERSIWNLSPQSALLDAKPPMSWATDTCIAIDGDGRVNVWTLYRDGTSWFALREWANEHRNLLALTRRDLVIDKQADVAVHIVLPLDHVAGEGAGADVVPTLLRTAAKNIHLYRLRHIQWNAKRGLLVVPIS